MDVTRAAARDRRADEPAVDQIRAVIALAIHSRSKGTTRKPRRSERNVIRFHIASFCRRRRGGRLCVPHGCRRGFCWLALWLRADELHRLSNDFEFRPFLSGFAVVPLIQFQVPLNEDRASLPRCLPKTKACPDVGTCEPSPLPPHPNWMIG